MSSVYPLDFLCLLYIMVSMMTHNKGKARVAEYAMDRELHRLIKVEAAKRDLTMGEFIDLAVKDFLTHETLEALSMKEDQ